ncbi:MAG TPA: hypothetical protein VGC99_28690 [Candidatus Tectomicrobia bacterium]
MKNDLRGASWPLWRRLFLEGAVILVSILLALGADAWWQERIDRAEEQVILVALRDELSGNEVPLRAQADSIFESVALLRRILELPEDEFLQAVAADLDSRIAGAVQRPWTVEFRVGALDGTMGSGKASLIRSHALTAELAQYQAVRRELDEIGGLLGEVAVDSFVSFGGLPQTYSQLRALLNAKAGYWTAYLRYLDRFITHTTGLVQLLEAELQ